MIHEAWFRFKGIDSRQMGVIVTAMPETVRAERRVQSITIAGRNGTLHMDEGVYKIGRLTLRQSFAYKRGSVHCLSGTAT